MHPPTSPHWMLVQNYLLLLRHPQTKSWEVHSTLCWSRETGHLSKPRLQKTALPCLGATHPAAWTSETGSQLDYRCLWLPVTIQGPWTLSGWPQGEGTEEGEQSLLGLDGERTLPPTSPIHQVSSFWKRPGCSLVLPSGLQCSSGSLPYFPITRMPASRGGQPGGHQGLGDRGVAPSLQP
ncbi:hypothetical protein P7K49_037129 [Saguinus oedipus]|uniref:Uncharacterized protein n=1 Tax=Saguinus oedipus TaxID=9490 RepID=A0ABQ9THC3_SAGOE|nr:hypothetical protein P7K49_037129 [Saguinus oedipus]